MKLRQTNFSKVTKSWGRPWGLTLGLTPSFSSSSHHQRTKREDISRLLVSSGLAEFFE